MSCTENQWFRWSEEDPASLAGILFYFQKTCLFARRSNDEAPSSRSNERTEKKRQCAGKMNIAYNVVAQRVRAGRRDKLAVLCVNG